MTYTVDASDDINIEGLGTLPGGAFRIVCDVNNDGSVIVGYSDGEEGACAFRWTESTGMQPFVDAPVRVLAVSSDGDFVVGINFVPQPGQVDQLAFRRSEATGFDDLGELPGGIGFAAGLAVSLDGSIVVGRSHSGTTDEAFI